MLAENAQVVAPTNDEFASPPTVEQLRSMPYVQLLALLGESNLPPGGFDTIRRLCLNTHLRPGLRVLHAGCNTAFLTCELARRSGASFVAADISPSMAAAAAKRVAGEGLSAQVQCRTEDMRRLSFESSTFDVVLSGGALAFVEGQKRAIQEWIRVVKPGGWIADAELFYHAPAPTELLRKVSSVIEVEVPAYDEAHWRSLFEHPTLQSYYYRTYRCEVRTDAEVRNYCEKMVEFCAPQWAPDSKLVLFQRLLDIMQTFNENMKYLSYSVFVYERLRDRSQPALFV